MKTKAITITKRVYSKLSEIESLQHIRASVALTQSFSSYIPKQPNNGFDTNVVPKIGLLNSVRIDEELIINSKLGSDSKKESRHDDEYNYNYNLQIIGLSTAIASASISYAEMEGQSDIVVDYKTDFEQYLKRIENNDPKLPKLDLSDIVLDEQQLQHLRDALLQNNQLGFIIWGEVSLPTDQQSKQLKTEIDTKLIKNNKEFKYKPNDYRLALLSKHAYQELSQLDEGKPVAFKFDTDDPMCQQATKWSEDLNEWHVHKIYNDRDKSGYFGVVYVNHENRQVVLSHRGTDVKLIDLLRKNSPLKTDIKSILENEITAHIIQSYIATAELVNNVKEDQSHLLNGYHITFTGHSLGGWLAEMSAYYCYKNFSKHFSRRTPSTVVFDSPGSKPMFDKFKSTIHNLATKFDPESLDIVTYLSAPNPVNICNERVGKVYTVYPTIQAAGDFISQLSEIVANNNDIAKGLRSIQTHSLIGIINQFDPNTGKPVAYKEAVDWPLLVRNSAIPRSVDYKGKVYDAVATAAVNALRVPAALELPAKETAKVVLSAMLEDTTIENIIEISGDFIGGRLDIQKFLDLQQYLDNDYRERNGLTLGEKFALKHGHHFNPQPVNDKDIVVGSLEGTTNWQIRQILEYRLLERNDIKPLTVTQLSDLFKNCRLDINRGDHKTHVYVSDTETLTLEEIIERFKRLIDIDDSVIGMLDQRNVLPVKIPEKKLASNIPALTIRYDYTNNKEQPLYFIRRIEKLQEIQNKIIQNKFIVIAAPGGTGKSTLAQAYALRYLDGGGIGRWVKENTIEEEFRAIGIELELIKKDEAVKPEDADILRRMIYNKLEEMGLKVVFIFDNVDTETYAIKVKKYVDDMRGNIHAIITSRGVDHLGVLTQRDAETNKKIIQLDPFNEIEAKLYLERNSLIPKDKISSIIDIIKRKDQITQSDYILPHSLSFVAGAFYIDKTLSVETYIEDYQQKKMNGINTKISPEFEIVLGKLFHRGWFDSTAWQEWWYGNDAWNILQYCAFLDSEFIPIEMLKAKEIGFTDQQITSGINALLMAGLISVTSSGKERGIKLHRITQTETKEYQKILPELEVKLKKENTLMNLASYFGAAVVNTDYTKLEQEPLVPTLKAILYNFNETKLEHRFEEKYAKLIADIAYISDAQANYYTTSSSGGIQTAKKLLEDAKGYIEAFILTPSPEITKSGEEIYDLLSHFNSALPGAYARILYSLGRIYFYDKKSYLPQIKVFKGYLQLAKEITEHDVTVQPNGEKLPRLDNMLVQTNGLLYLDLDSTDKKTLLDAADSYKDWLDNQQKYIDKNNEEVIPAQKSYHKSMCHRQLATTYTKLANLFVDERQSYINEAMVHAIEAARIEPERGSNLNVLANTLLSMSNLQKKEMQNLFQGNNKIISKIEKSISNQDLAEEILKFLIEDSRNKLSRIPCISDAKYKLAKIYLEDNRLQEATMEIDDCILIQTQQMKRLNNHQELKAAINLKKNIQNYLLAKAKYQSAMDYFDNDKFQDAKIVIDECIYILKEQIKLSDDNAELTKAIDLQYHAQSRINIEREYNKLCSTGIVEVWHMAPVYQNPLLNDPNIQTILRVVNQLGGAGAINQIIDLGSDYASYTKLANNIRLEGVEAAIARALSLRTTFNSKDKSTPLLINNIKNSFTEQAEFSSDKSFIIKNIEDSREHKTEVPKNDQLNLHSITVTSFAIKEMIEATPTLKYFAYKILGVQYVIPQALQDIELPEFTKQNYFWVSMHYVVGATGALTLPATNIDMMTKLMVPLAASLTYGVKLKFYDYLTEQRQLALQNQDDTNKTIDTPIEFVEQCGLDMFAYAMFSTISNGMNLFLFGMPLINIGYDIAMSSVMGGVQCYSSYQQQLASKSNELKTVTEALVPYITDGLVLYMTAGNIKFDSSNLAISMFAIKQGLTAISTVVITDQITKLFLHVNSEAINDIEMSYINPIFCYVNEKTTNIIGNIYSFFDGQENCEL